MAHRPTCPGEREMLHRFESCELDTDARERRRHGDPLHLEPQVFDVLAFLRAT